MLNQPINVTPSVLSGVGEGVVDATLPLTISWQVSGDTPMLAYRIVIQKNDTSSTQVYTTGKVTLSTPFYGNDNKGNTQTFSATAITASQLSTAGIVNGYANGYKILITQWWGATDADSITQTSPSYFITRAKPTLTFSIASYTTSNPYTQKDITVNAVFSQAQGDSVKTIRWMLYEGQSASESHLLLDTGDIETQILQFQYDGLFPETYYYITASAQSTNGVSVSANATVYVDYDLGEAVGQVSVCKPYGADCVEVTWQAVSSIDGEPSGTVTYADGIVHIPDQENISYSPMHLSTPWTIVWKGKPMNMTQMDVFTIDTSAGQYAFTSFGDYERFSFDGNIILLEDLFIHYGDTLTIIITPTHLYIRHDTYTGGLLPRQGLYPEETLYPQDITRTVEQHSHAITYTQYNINKITLGGDQYCDYLFVSGSELSQSTINKILTDRNYEPVATYDTLFLTNFNDNTLEAYISGTGGSLLSTAVYRREQGKPMLQHVVDVTNGMNTIRDYGVKANTTYQYYIFVIDSDVYSKTLTSTPYTPKYNNFTMMECVYDESDGAYHVQAAYPFACNATQSAISNNNAPNIMRNFTRYPNRQGVNSLHDSGTLTALIGKVNQEVGTYQDTWELADKISAMSVNDNPKFLRDMKGKIWRIETSEAITKEVVNAKAYAPIKITIPWIEIGDAGSDTQIVAVYGDPVFTSDEINLTTFQVDTNSGDLLWTTPDNYNGTVISLKNGMLKATTPYDVYPAQLSINSEGDLESYQ